MRNMLKNQFAARMMLAFLAVAVPVGGVAVFSFVRTQLSLAPIPQAPPKFRVEQQKLPGDVRSLHCSPNGGAYCLVTNDGRVYVFKRRGSLQYSIGLKDVTAALVTNDAGYAVVYSERDPSRTSLTFLDSSGRIIWKLPVRGAIWCADLFGNAQRAIFAVGTGKDYVYLVELAPGSRRFRRFRVSGAVSSVALDEKNEVVFVATWQRSRIGCYGLKGRRVWEIDVKPNLLYQVHATGVLDKVMAYGSPLVPGIAGCLCAVRGGNVMWRRDIDTTACSNVVFACEGDYICLAQESTIRHAGRSVKEKRAVLLDGSGNALIDKGSLFFNVYPVMVTRQGSVLLCGNEKALFSMNRVGKMEKVTSLPSRILGSAVSQNGTLVLLKCKGGILIRLTLLPL